MEDFLSGYSKNFFAYSGEEVSYHEINHNFCVNFLLLRHHYHKAEPELVEFQVSRTHWSYAQIREY
jgi:hypothetical protein